MTSTEPILLLPPDETVIWRYMDFARFMSVLDKSSLWFSRIGTFEDSHEGAFSIPGSMAMLAEIAKNGGMPPGEALDFMYRVHGAVNTISRMCGFANCWCGNNGESVALWDLYGQGVAIRTTIGRLKASIIPNRHVRVQFGQVSYVGDPETEITDNVRIEKALLTKRLAYEHEKEVRAFFLLNPPDEFLNDLSKYRIPPGKSIRVDLNKLIERVLVAPNQSEWFKDLVESMVKLHARLLGFAAKPVDWSALRSTPVFHRNPAEVISRPPR